MQGLSLVAASGDHSSSRCAGLSPSRPLLLRSTGSRRAGSVIVAHGPSCSAACGIFPDQGSNPCPLHWQADSQPLRHQGSPQLMVFNQRFRATSLDGFLAERAGSWALCGHTWVPSPMTEFYESHSDRSWKRDAEHVPALLISRCCLVSRGPPTASCFLFRQERVCDLRLCNASANKYP